MEESIIRDFTCHRILSVTLTPEDYTWHHLSKTFSDITLDDSVTYVSYVVYETRTSSVHVIFSHTYLYLMLFESY